MMRRTHSLLAWAGAVLAACGVPADEAPPVAAADAVSPPVNAAPDATSPAHPAPDAFRPAKRDAVSPPDAPATDAGPAPSDAGSASPDGPTTDAIALPISDSASPDAIAPPMPDAGFVGVACAVEGAVGRCTHVADCPADHHPTPGYCPGPAEIQCCTLGRPPDPLDCDSDALVRPNALPGEPPGVDGCPDGMLRVAAFCVDRYEAALIEVDAAGNAPWSPFHNPGNRRVRAVSVAGVVPQGYINGVQAGAACAEAGKRLCTDAEWLRACQGPEALTYPYGGARQPGVCNDARARHPAVELYPDDPTPFDRIQDACINQLPDALDPTGENAGCVTAEGAFDMMGNLHEWTSDPAGTFRGGFYVDTVVNGPGCLYRTTAHDTGHWDYSTGFRCCADPAAR